MKNVRNYILIILLVCLMIGCRRMSQILPEAEISFIKDYQCWPYNVSLYSVEEVKIDSLFYSYPLKKYYFDNTRYEVSTWIKYTDKTSKLLPGIVEIVEHCDETGLYNRLKGGEDLYFSGSYSNQYVEIGKEERRYEIIIFLDIRNNKLYFFKDINKIY